MIITAKLFLHGGSQAVLLPEEFRFEGKEVRISKIGDRVILEPTQRPDAAASRMSLAKFHDLPSENGRARDSNAGDSHPMWLKVPTKQPIDFEEFWAELDALGASDYLPDGIPDDSPLQPDPRKFFDD